MDLQAAQVLGYIASLGQPALAGLLRMFRRFDAARQFAGGGGEAANAALRRARGRDAIFSPVATGLSVFTFAPRHRTVCWFCQMSTVSYAGYFSFTAIKFIYIEPRDCCTVCALEPAALSPLPLGCWCRCKPLPGIWTSFNSYRVIVTALDVSIGVRLPDEHWPETMSRTNRRKNLYGGYGGTVGMVGTVGMRFGGCGRGVGAVPGAQWVGYGGLQWVRYRGTVGIGYGGTVQGYGGYGTGVWWVCYWGYGGYWGMVGIRVRRVH